MKSMVNSNAAGPNPTHAALVYHRETMQTKGTAIHG
jgi:hypothetical protein